MDFTTLDPAGLDVRDLCELELLNNIRDPRDAVLLAELWAEVLAEEPES